MAMVTSNFTVAELCRQYSRDELSVNRKYQRSEKVWPDAARSFLIETIILGFPVPKIILWEKTDTKTLVTHREVVDGQQRTQAIYDFYTGSLRLGNKLDTEELRGSLFAEIPSALQQRFVTYAVGCDILVGSTEEDVREIFRRMNSYTVPLNPEEQRHAVYQGEFKWFVYELSRTSAAMFEMFGTFRENDFVRMRDSKLLTEIIHAQHYGIQTTSKAKLDKLYKENDKEFEQHEVIRDEVHNALEKFEEIGEYVTGTALAKQFNVYSLILAIIALQSDNDLLQASLDIDRGPFLSAQRIAANFGLLAECLEADDPDEAGDYKSFYLANKSQTNTMAHRVLRFNWFAKALTEQL